MEEVLRRYELTEEEFLSWQRAFESHGLPGLRTTRIQQYRRSRRRNQLRELNTEIAKSPCKRAEPPEILVSPTEPPAPPSPDKQTPTQR